MEVLKSGDAPALVTNLEVLRLLRDRADARERGAKGVRDNAAFRHRDWIERAVADHLAASPAGGAGVRADALPELVARLRGAPAPPGAAAVKVEEGAGAGAAPQPGGYGLTDGEALQVLNHFPTLLVDVHLLIEDVERRAPLAEEDQRRGLLRLVSEYSGRPVEEGDGGDDAADEDA